MYLTMAALVLFASSANGFFTPLETENHPCKPENLKRTNRYVCDSSGNIICQSGWRDPDVMEPLHNLNPCLQPICENPTTGSGCLHGECRAPNFCACEIGWEGTSCDKCVKLPGCDHGTCNNAFDCICDEGYAGAYCDIPQCTSCMNGECIEPEKCVCLDGWLGTNCDQCQAMPGCKHGRCGEHPHTCKCDPGWEGHLCDKPTCVPNCIHGFCHNGPTNNFCVCQSGWGGDDCGQCRPYWECPNKVEATACNVPNECLCPEGTPDPDGLCQNQLLLKMGTMLHFGKPLENQFVPADMSITATRKDFKLDDLVTMEKK